MANQMYGRPDQFLSREQQLEYRACTKLLELTESIERRAVCGVAPGSKPIATDLQTQGWAKYLSCINTLLVRDDETVSLLSHSKKNVLIAIRTNPAGMSSKDILGQSTVEGQLGQSFNRSAQRATPTSMAPLEARFSTPELPFFEGDIFPFFISRLRDFKNQPIQTGPQAGTLPYPFKFSAHCDIVIDLLKRLHDSPSGHANKGVWVLRYYVLMASNSKMLKRFDSSAHGINAGSDILKYLQLRGSHSRFTTECHALETADLSLDLPDHNHRAALRRTLRRFAKSTVLSREEALRFGWDMATETFDSSKPVYDKDGRERLQTLMAISLTRVYRGVNALKDEIAKNVPKQADATFQVPLDDAVKAVKAIVKSLCLDLHSWAFLHLAFKKILEEKHLKWLQMVFKLDNTTQVINITDVGPAFQRLLSQKPIDEGDIAEAVEYYAIDTDANCEYRWAKKTSRYLQLITAHMDALVKLSLGWGKRSDSFHLNQMSGKLQIKTLEIWSGPEDTTALSINSILKTEQTVSSYGNFWEETARSQRDVDLVKMWLKERLQETDPERFGDDDKLAEDEVEKMLTSTSFAGAVHPEAAQLALNALAMDPPDWYEEVPRSGAIHVRHAHPSVPLPLRDVIKELEGVRDIPTVSRVCCSACSILNNGLSEFKIAQYVPKVRYAHTVWTCHALPAWLPDKMAHRVYNHATAQVERRLRMIIHEQGNKVALRRRLAREAQ